MYGGVIMSESKPWKDCELEEELRECMEELAWYREKLKQCREEVKDCKKKLKRCEDELSREEEEDCKKRKHRKDGYDDEDHTGDDEKKRKGSDRNKRGRKDEDSSEDKDWKDRKPCHKDKNSFNDELQQYVNRRVVIGTGGQTQKVVIIKVEDHYVKAMVVGTGAIVTYQISRIDYVESAS